jgi:hypothetical protein
VILIHFLLIFTESKTFQQTGQIISQSDSDSTKNHFSGVLFLSESRTVRNTPLGSSDGPKKKGKETLWKEDIKLILIIPVHQERT